MGKQFLILIVEDDLFLSEILQEILTSFGCQTMGCTNGQDALDMIDKENINLIISDIKMPKMNGVILLEELEKRGLNIPTVMMTGFSEFKEEDVLNRGGVVLLEKPFSKEKVKELFDNYIKLLMAA